MELFVFYSTVVFVVIVMIFVVWLVLIPHLFGAPFLRSGKKTRKVMFELAQVKPGELIADLGSGDGVFLIEAAHLGARAIGYEINPFLVAKSRLAIRQHKLEHLASVKKQNLWSADLSQVDVVMVFGIMHIMPQLYKKLQRELKPGARVISNTFTFPKWKPVREKENVRLYVKE